MDAFVAAFKTMFGVTDTLIPYLLAVSGLGTITMALIEALKDTTPICRWYQRFQMYRWIKRHAGVAAKNLGRCPDRKKTEEQLILLATDGDQRSFYNLEIEKLCGQWNAAVQIVLDYPKLYPDLFECLAARTDKADFNKVLQRKFPDPLPPDAEAMLPLAEQKERYDLRQAFSDSRLRVTHQIQRAIDSFQINTAFRWKWILQLGSYFVSGSIAEYALHLSKGKISEPSAFVTAALAGFLAPVASDLLAAIQKLRVP